VIKKQRRGVGARRPDGSLDVAVPVDNEGAGALGRARRVEAVRLRRAAPHVDNGLTCKRMAPGEIHSARILHAATRRFSLARPGASPRREQVASIRAKILGGDSPCRYSLPPLRRSREKLNV